MSNKGKNVFSLAFYVLHELDDQYQFLQELLMLLEMNGRVLVAEAPLRVSKAAVAVSLATAGGPGLTVLNGPPVLFSKSAVWYIGEVFQGCDDTRCR